VPSFQLQLRAVGAEADLMGAREVDREGSSLVTWLPSVARRHRFPQADALSAVFAVAELADIRQEEMEDAAQKREEARAEEERGRARRAAKDSGWRLHGSLPPP